MKQAFKNIVLICTMLVFIPFISYLPMQINQKQFEPTNVRNTAEAERLHPEILKPSNWIARGGCWDFSSKIFFSRGYRGGNIAYYKKQDYKNFTYEVKVMKIAEDGPLGIIFRYDDARDEGYVFAFMPHGEYFLSTFIGQSNVYLKKGATAHLNEEMNTWNTLKIVVNGAKFDCYINDSFLVSVTDQTYSVGKIGLYNSPDPRQIAKFEVISLVEH